MVSVSKKKKKLNYGLECLFAFSLASSFSSTKSTKLEKIKQYTFFFVFTCSYKMSYNKIKLTYIVIIKLM